MDLLLDTHTFLWYVGGKPERDPFDRLIIAQSLTENMAVVSADQALDAYGVTRLW